MSAVTRGGSMMNWKRRQAIEGWIFVLPVMLGLAVFVFYPTILSFGMAFTRWDGLTQAVFVGLDNYRLMFVTDAVFWQVLNNTIYLTAGSIPFAMAGGLILALLVNQKIAGVTLFRALYFLPVVTSAVAIGIVWAWMFSSYYGLINFFLTPVLNLFGLPPIAWLRDINWAMPAVIIVSVWFRVGYNMVLFLAGLQGVPDSLYEAASIDGAGRWSQFRHITWPMLTPTTFFIAIISIISSFQVFNLVYIMTQGGPGYTTSVYVYYLYQVAFQYFRMGQASAMATALFLFLVALTFFQFKMANRWVFYG